VSGWLLILALLVLGGVLSTLGDRLGSKVGKARLSLLGLRPRSTAVLITVLTGSLISAISLGLMLLVSDRLRTGLFELDHLERRLRDSRQALSSSQARLERSQSDLHSAEAGQRQARRRLRQVEGQAVQLRRELAPLQQQRLRLEQERDRLSTRHPGQGCRHPPQPRRTGPREQPHRGRCQGTAAAGNQPDCPAPR